MVELKVAFSRKFVDEKVQVFEPSLKCDPQRRKEWRERMWASSLDDIVAFKAHDDLNLWNVTKSYGAWVIPPANLKQISKLL